MILSGEPKRILLIEPGSSRQRQLRSLFTACGVKSVDIDSVDDMAKAVGLLRKRRYDLCFLATTLPGTSLRDSISQVRSNSFGRPTLIVAVGPALTREEVRLVLDSGVQGILTAPFSLAHVEEVLGLAFR